MRTVLGVVLFALPIIFFGAVIYRAEGPRGFAVIVGGSLVAVSMVLVGAYLLTTGAA